MKYFDGKLYSNHGDPKHVLYANEVLDDGSIHLVPSGVEDTDEIIESHRQSTDMNIILAKIANGDVSVLEKRNPMYGDFTEMPKTYAEALQMQIDSERMYNELPAEVKSKFDNDKNKFFAAAGTEEWFDKLGYTKKIEESEVKEVE